MVSRWPSLTDGALDQLWARVRERLERQGVANRGRVSVPELSSGGRLALGTLLGGRAPGATVRLDVLEAALAALGVGDDLPTALAVLGHPVSPEPASRRAARMAGRDARDAARAEASTWAESWAPAWADQVIRAGGLRGLDIDGAVDLVRSVRAVLDRLTTSDGDGPVSRTDLAAAVLGSAHALDRGSRIEAAVTRALGHQAGEADAQQLWQQAGVHLDLVSAPVLTWNLVVPGPLGELCRAATDLGVPLHLSQLALRTHPTVASGVDVLVVENPRVVEAAAQTRSSVTVVATNGNPSGTVQLLVAQLAASGARLRYHGDFDSAGLAICARMACAGCTPWRMDADDYRAALAVADSEGVILPVDPRPAPATPWDPALQAAFDHDRRIVHEERLLAEVLVIGPELRVLGARAGP